MARRTMSPHLQAKAVIFDFDGTLTLSEPVHMQAFRDIAAALNRPLPPDFLEKSIGQTDQRLARDLSLHWQGQFDEQTLLTMKRRYYQARCATEGTMVAGAADFVKALSQHLPLGLATSASVGDVAPILERHGLAAFFTSILTVEDVRQAKPDPEIYLLSATNLKTKPADCLVFEDSPIGARAARAAGMRVVGMLTSYTPEILQPIVLALTNFEDHEQLVDLIAQG